MRCAVSIPFRFRCGSVRPSVPPAYSPPAPAWCRSLFASFGLSLNDPSLGTMTEGVDKGLEAMASALFAQQDDALGASRYPVAAMGGLHHDSPTLMPPMHPSPEPPDGDANAEE